MKKIYHIKCFLLRFSQRDRLIFMHWNMHEMNKSGCWPILPLLNVKQKLFLSLSLLVATLQK